MKKIGYAEDDAEKRDQDETAAAGEKQAEEEDKKPDPPAPESDPPPADTAEEKKPEEPLEGAPAEDAPPPEDDGGTETPPPAEDTAKLRAELAAARAQVAAYRAGIRPDAVDDAVILAMHSLQQSGVDPTDEAVAAALQQVVGRHKEWTARLPPPAVRGGVAAPDEEKKPRYAPTGKVFF